MTKVRLFGGLIAACVAGCGLMPIDAAMAARRAPAAPAASPTPAYEKEFPKNATWRLIEFNGKPLPAGIDASLTIDTSLRGAGSSGCNTWSATMYPVRGQHLAVGPVALTKKSCAPAVMAFERAYLTAIHAGPTWDEVNGYLVVKSAAGTCKFARGL